MKEQEIEKGDCMPPTQKVIFLRFCDKVPLGSSPTLQSEIRSGVMHKSNKGNRLQKKKLDPTEKRQFKDHWLAAQWKIEETNFWVL